MTLCYNGIIVLYIELKKYNYAEIFYYKIKIVNHMHFGRIFSMQMLIIKIIIR